MRTSRIVRAAAGIFALASALTGAGCSEDSPAAPQGPAPCEGAVVIAVGPGVEPEFSWTPACLAHWLLVEPAGSGTDQWGVYTEAANALASPVKYARVPEGAQQFNAPVVLVAGTQYEVYLTRWIGPTDTDIELIGVQSFTP
ncbi:MAG: hypothetical protein ACT4PE_16860 [Candidatus Eiseniibacteriota bacterium]